MTVDPRKFLLNTDYEMDKIIYYKSSSITASQTTQTFAHNLGFTPLVFGVCSTDQNFSTSHSVPYQYIAQSDYISFEAKANGTNIVLTYYNFGAPSSTMYYRIYAFEPSNSAAKIAPTSGNASKFVLNTDYNYCKLLKKGIINGSGTNTVAHNLGYIPQVLAWGENSGYTAPIENSQPQDPVFNEPTYISVNNSSITVRNPGSYTKVHYRIYYDEG